MDFELLRKIRSQIEPPIIVSWHRDGDPLVYERLGEALQLFSAFPSSVVTHGEALNARAEEVIGNCTTITVSVLPKDPDRQIQLESIRRFLEKKGAQPPVLQLKFVGRIDDAAEYEALGVPIINRALHNRKGNWTYQVEPTIPEIRVCLDLLGSPTVDWRGKVYACNRLDPGELGLIGDLNTETLDAIWNGPKRQAMLKAHLAGRRDLANELCKSCHYYGVPTPSG